MNTPPTNEHDAAVLAVEDGIWALALTLGAAFLFAATVQGRMMGDGIAFVNGVGAQHPLLLPTTDAVERLWPGLGRVGALHLVVGLFGALGVGASFVLARACGAGRGGAATACALLATAPVTWFFSTLIEVHAFRFGLTALCALVPVLAPWRRPALALALTVVTFPLVYGAHQSGALLGFGWLGLVQLGRVRSAAPFGWKTLLGLIGPLLLAALLASIGAANLARTGTLFGDQSATLGGYVVALGGQATLWSDWIVPLAFLWPLAALGLVVARPSGVAGGALLALLLPYLGFLAWIAIPERGGYLLGAAPFVACLAACALSRVGRLIPLVALVVLLQAWTGYSVVRAHDDGFDPEVRAELIDALVPDGAWIFSAHHASPRVENYVPRVKEHSLVRAIYDARSFGIGPEALAAAGAAWLALQPPGMFLLDVTHPDQIDREQQVSVTRPFVRALEAELERRFVLERHERGGWVLLRVVRKR